MYSVNLQYISKHNLQATRVVFNIIGSKMTVSSTYFTNLVHKPTMYICLSLVFNNFVSCVQGTIYMYYGLKNFYQNHRRYVKSRDDFQLLGQLSESPSTDCDPFRTINGKPVAPCGAIANSLFSGMNKAVYSQIVLIKLLNFHRLCSIFIGI